MQYLDRDMALKCARMALGPIVRFGLRHSLRVQDLIEQVKVASIEIATAEIAKINEEANVCRLSAVTGLHRRDVRRIYLRNETKSSAYDPCTRVIGAWQSDPRFVGKSGRPRVLTCEGAGNEFQILMESVSTDLTAGTVLFELERLGAVERVEGGIKLVYRSLTVRRDPERAFEMLADDMDDMLCAVEENISNETADRNLHAKTVYDNIAIEDLPKAQSWLVREGAKFHQRARLFLSKLDLDLAPASRKTPGGKIAVGTFTRTLRPQASKRNSRA
ncbi:MAG: hypothetical protein K1X79_11290 [Oligoflexia bacterium]|nr:hypothetical protein [Oligoflexia bacterium]